MAKKAEMLHFQVLKDLGHVGLPKDIVDTLEQHISNLTLILKYNNNI